MDDSRTARLVGAVLRCYPTRWRRRHGDEAAELAALLIKDGTPAGSIAFSYLAGAAREWLTPRPGRRLSAVAGVLLAVACLLGVSTALIAPVRPARAASTTQARPPAHCRPRSPEPVAGAFPVTSRPQMITRIVGHGRPC
jgi:hypothetical protein